MKWLLLSAGGVLGTLARYGIGSLVYRAAGIQFPYGTVAVNMIGCFLIGVFDVWSHQKMGMSHALRLFLMAGFCGAFTTFSSFILETGHLLREGHSLLAFVNLSASVLFGFLFFRAGMLFAKLL